MHDEVRRFPLDGEIADASNLVETRDRLVYFVETAMRDHGFVPALDLEPQFTLDYDLDKETYKFVLSVYGIYLGREESWRCVGVMSGKKIMRSTPPAK